MVHALAVKKGNGNFKTVVNPAYPNLADMRLPVMRAAHHIVHDNRGMRAEPHPEAFDFAVDEWH